MLTEVWFILLAIIAIIVGFVFGLGHVVYRAIVMIYKFVLAGFILKIKLHTEPYQKN